MPHAVIDMDAIVAPAHNRKRYLVDGKLECPDCHVWKPLHDYHKDASRPYAAAWRCKVCTCAASRKYHKEKYAGSEGQRRYLEQQRDYTYRRKYGLTLEEVKQKFANQAGCCAICRSALNLGTQRKAMAHIDHDHTTGDVRGILCTHCNTGLGHFKENPELFFAAVEYLKYYKEKT